MMKITAKVGRKRWAKNLRTFCFLLLAGFFSFLMCNFSGRMLTELDEETVIGLDFSISSALPSSLCKTNASATSRQKATNGKTSPKANQTSISFK